MKKLLLLPIMIFILFSCEKEPMPTKKSIGVTEPFITEVVGTPGQVIDSCHATQQNGYMMVVYGQGKIFIAGGYIDGQGKKVNISILCSKIVTDSSNIWVEPKKAQSCLRVTNTSPQDGV